MRPFAIADFPSAEQYVRAKWAPILLRPILGSPEQVVVGVAAVNASGFYLERATDLFRLECLLGENAAVAILAASAGLDALQADLASRSIDALSDYRPAFSGIAIGELRDAEGESLQAVAKSWLATLSSLAHRESPAASKRTKTLADEPGDVSPQRDRLPILVLEYMKAKRPETDKFFSREIREQRPDSGNASEVRIDYSGSKIVANFGALLVSQHKRSVLRITKGLWDLKVDKDGERTGWTKRDHEMLIQHPPFNDPQFTQKQLDTMGEALRQLEKQADQEEIRLRSMHSVSEIGEHLLQRDAA
ncbi:hypothetical protein SSBR45G_03210 [Bradyrhizobium sp. SSBR45G]|uniref:hypothetical protein n=1 Tax=unclassified Bradyrhizobium TaxID=2631580 RepID=UPI002342B815|nr:MULTISPECIES: hypothetical protein [unclassified Bradyrhizobium]GLH75413.1 hypothetical protein SSBR45G_03210 [Bradyrhizobium sp. SSBR45G]GLH82800.1 hypothetical protein SSBR45R_02600 [Bradyrhizobium sp. SSBR45R]